MSTENDASTTRVIGQVKWFNTKTGYGFITVKEGQHEGKDIFTHYSSIRVNDSQYKYLVQGEYVEFIIIQSSQGNHEFQSSDVTGIKAGSLMCETRKQNMQEDKQSTSRRYRTRTQPQQKSSSSPTD